jgi:hypothetical protein
MVIDDATTDLDRRRAALRWSIEVMAVYGGTLTFEVLANVGTVVVLSLPAAPG